MNKQIYVCGGGTFNFIRNHLALSAPAFGKTAKELFKLSQKKFTNMDVNLILTKMADSNSDLVTNADVSKWADKIINDNSTKIVFFSFAMADFEGQIDDVISDKYAERLQTSDGEQTIILTPAEKVLNKIRKTRKDIFLVGFKTTCNLSDEEMFTKGLYLMKKNSCNLVLVNDTARKRNMIVTPEESTYAVTDDREKALTELVDMAFLRSHLSFTRSTVVDGKPVDWNSPEVYPSLRKVVNFCIAEGAYKIFNGSTVGHFACKLNENTFLTSIRKTNFNDIHKNGLVKVVTDGEDSVIAYGAKPSVGGQSQRLIFNQHPDFDCIVHFHCPLKDDHKNDIPVVSQREFECGSHQCGENTSKGLGIFNNGKIACVMLDNHGPNIVFNHKIEPEEVIQFIQDNFDLQGKTLGFTHEHIFHNSEEQLIN